MRLSNRHQLHTTRTTGPAHTPLLELRDICLTRARTPLLTHLDLTVHAGEHITLLTLEPAAATALTDLIAGRTTPTHGHITTHTTPHIHTPRTGPTLAHAVTGRSHPDPHDPHLQAALDHARLPAPHTPLTDLIPAHTRRLHSARTHHAHHTDARLLVLSHPSADEHLTTTPTTGLLHLDSRPTHTRDADRILLLHQGRITETGTHRQLLVRGGAYARLYALHGAHRTRP
ncbi:ABC transporter ATP-binding protein [Nocardiopsis algeriensis]|uniref:Uncharacterized protein n=1 Tax=Nocardiopsis algeriensis TaxID=1478215 RepID=A0A841IV33_9ACTN|nr:hypothetical protein [Nocardiopsis algeriensis]